MDWVLLGGLAVVATAVGALGWQAARLGRAVRAAGGVEALECRQAVSQLRGELQQVRSEQAQLAGQLARCVQRVGMVRYDAFQGSGGKLSFSVALLDAHGDGVVLSVLHSRDGSYAYAKALRGGRPSHPLSDEEQQAVLQAMG